MKIFTIPNALTLCNLFCGCVGIVAVFHNDMLLASVMIVVAGVFDFFDGFAARLLKSSSPIGKELDSLADMVTFGALPSFMIYYYIQLSVPDLESIWKAYFAFLIALFSALRLAKFNVDERQSYGFIGVPTPANALLIASFPFIREQYPAFDVYLLNANYLIGFSLLMCLLLVAELPLFALKFKNFSWKGNEIKFIFIGISAILLFLLKFAGIPMVIVLYILLSFSALFRK
jgi:CDP-diacylglycerol---serine O-phosphatidyltransferase